MKSAPRKDTMEFLKEIYGDKALKMCIRDSCNPCVVCKYMTRRSDKEPCAVCRHGSYGGDVSLWEWRVDSVV